MATLTMPIQIEKGGPNRLKVACPDGMTRSFQPQGLTKGNKKGVIYGYVQVKGTSVSGVAKRQGRSQTKLTFVPHANGRNAHLIRPVPLAVGTELVNGVIAGVEWDGLTPVYRIAPHDRRRKAFVHVGDQGLVKAER